LGNLQFSKVLAFCRLVSFYADAPTENSRDGSFPPAWTKPHYIGVHKEIGGSGGKETSANLATIFTALGKLKILHEGVVGLL